MRRRALELIFGDNPTATERLAFTAVSFIPGYLPELADLSDEELREALRTTMLHILRVPSRSNAGRGRSLRGGGCLLPPAWTGT